MTGTDTSAPTTGCSTWSVLQITDVHLLRNSGERLLGMDTEASLKAVLEQALAEETPDALLVTGDIAHDPHPQVYQRFLQILDRCYDGPRLMLLGNHDVSERMGDLADPGVLSVGCWDIIALDSHVDDEPAASVGVSEIRALQSACEKAADRHALVATHHPPIELDCPWLDKDRIKNGAELLEWMSEHSTVRAMVFGHAHQIVESTFRDIVLLGTPSTCVQFAPRTRKFTLDSLNPGYRWLRLSDDGAVSSEVRRLQDYDDVPDMAHFNPKGASRPDPQDSARE